MDYANRLKEQRELYGISQSALAKATGINQQTISLWETGKNIPSVDFCVTLAQFYGITIDELIGLSDTPKTEQQITRTLPAEPPNKTVAFVNEYGELFDDNNFRNITKLYQAAPKELRAVALGYLIGLFQSNGVNTKKILGY